MISAYTPYVVVLSDQLAKTLRQVLESTLNEQAEYQPTEASFSIGIMYPNSSVQKLR